MRTFLIITLFTLLYSFSAVAQNENTIPIDTLKKGKGYNLFSKTAKINSIVINKKKKPKANMIYIYFGFPEPIPTSNAIRSNVLGGKMVESRDNLPKFDKIDILTGKYDEIKVNPDTKYRNLFTFTGLEFPIRLKLTSGLEVVDFEILEAGEWNIDIELKNNQKLP